MSQPARLNEPTARHASRIATISAWAVGSFVEVTWFQPLAMIVPWRAMMAPNGPPSPAAIFSAESAMARRIKASGTSSGARIAVASHLDGSSPTHLRPSSYQYHHRRANAASDCTPPRSQFGNDLAETRLFSRTAAGAYGGENAPRRKRSTGPRR